MDQSLDLTSCDREKINPIAAIQPHGFFFAFRLIDQTVYHASENAAVFFKLVDSDVIGKSLEDIFGAPLASTLQLAASRVTEKTDEYLQAMIDQDRFDVRLFEFDGLIGSEFEKVNLQNEIDWVNGTSAVKNNQTYAEELHSAKTLTHAAQIICRSVRHLIDFDRVMLYRYLPNWDGEVIAEDKSAEAHSFLHHRFPASDIPLPARQMYFLNRSRQIADSSATPISIQPDLHYLTRKPIDLSYSKLRAVSPNYLSYLKNMGVAASFSVAVIVDGELWGLVACHGMKSTTIDHNRRLACELMASTFAVVAKLTATIEKQEQKIIFEDQLKSLFREILTSENIISTLFKRHGWIEQLFNATGIAFVSPRRIEIAGLTPPESYIRQISDSLKNRMSQANGSIINVESLTSIAESFRQLQEIACGLLAVNSPANDAVFMIFRPEILRTITWGGDPRKTLNRRQYGGEINPRESFESWTETLKGHSAPWETYELRGAEYLRDFALNHLLRKESLLIEISSKF